MREKGVCLKKFANLFPGDSEKPKWKRGPDYLNDSKKNLNFLGGALMTTDLKEKISKAKKSKKFKAAGNAAPLEGHKLPKWKTLEKITVLLTSEQRDAVDDLVRTLMRFRSHEDVSKDERERITANSIFRALLDNFISKAISLEIEAIQNEDELRKWINRLFK